MDTCYLSLLTPTFIFNLQYAKDSDPIVADSCIVALDMLDHELSGNFEYCAA
jgi:hypothetical protein